MTHFVFTSQTQSQRGLECPQNSRSPGPSLPLRLSLSLGLAACLLVPACEITGNPYEDSFFFSSHKAEKTLGEMQAELAAMHSQLGDDRARISRLKKRVAATRHSNLELQQEIAQLETLDTRATALQQQTAPARRASRDSAPAVGVLQRKSDELSRQLQLLEKKLQ